MTCPKCGKRVAHGSSFVKINPTRIARTEGESSKDFDSIYFHRDCFDKLFIYRNDNGEDFGKNLCTCGKFASYTDGGYFLCLHINVAGNRYGLTRYYHLNCFVKYWMGSVCDGDLKC